MEPSTMQSIMQPSTLQNTELTIYQEETIQLAKIKTEFFQ